MKIYKTPKFENDSYYFVVEKNDNLTELPCFKDTYYGRKLYAFIKKDISKMQFLDFRDRPSFRYFDKVEDLSGTIYTMSCEDKNDLTFETMIELVRENVGRTRRCVINMANTLRDYLNEDIDTSCLTSITYSPEKVTLFFRASDMENELLVDLLLLRDFFIYPVYDTLPEIHVISATAQNVNFNPFNLIR